MANELPPHLLKPGTAFWQLLGCRFGVAIGIPGIDDQPCTRQAVHIIFLHTETGMIELRLCDTHGKLVEELTTPTKDPS